MYDGETVEKYLELTEEWMPPWCMYLPNKKAKKDVAQQRWERLRENLKTPQDRYELFFRNSHDPVSMNNLIKPEISEYLDLKFLSEKFGLKPWEVERCRASWVMKIMAVANADIKVKNERLNS